VNSTAACALAAVKVGVPVAHIEAGLRSRDWTMPEEINRVVTDALSDLLFTTSRDAGENLRREGVDPRTIHFVGNTMIDTLRRFERAARERPVLQELGLEASGFILVTLHRPSNVDDARDLARLVRLLTEIADRLPAVFPLHPRTRKGLGEEGLLPALEAHPRLRLLPPLGYLDFLGLMSNARAVVTDSGGVQEETTALGVACLTVRPNTERPVTVSEGTNLIVSEDAGQILACLDRFLGAEIALAGRMPEHWDGRAGDRIVDALLDWRSRGMPARVRPHDRA
jgi:UDP-N-acetylglucosamine 2-epimerase (non-hydrolysing)